MPYNRRAKRGVPAEVTAPPPPPAEPKAEEPTVPSVTPPTTRRAPGQRSPVARKKR